MQMHFEVEAPVSEMQWHRIAGWARAADADSARFGEAHPLIRGDVESRA